MPQTAKRRSSQSSKQRAASRKSSSKQAATRRVKPTSSAKPVRIAAKAGPLKGTVAMITNSQAGSTAAVAVALAREGADLAVLHAPDEQTQAQDIQKAIEKEGRRCLLIAGDADDPEFCEIAVRYAIAELGQLDLLLLPAIQPVIASA